MKKVLIGCGVVAGVLVAGLMVIGFLARSWFEKSVPRRELQTARAQLRERFGDPDSFVPALDGRLDPVRVETFVAMRESLLSRRSDLGGRIMSFIVTAKTKQASQSSKVGKAIGALSMAQGGLGLYGDVVKYLQSRGDRLLAAGMGEGEYGYLYSVAYFSWLQWDPLAKQEDADALRKIGLEEEVLEAWREHGRTLRRQLENAMRALEQKPERSPGEEEMLALLRPEIESARATGRFPFAGHVPPQWAAVLEPFRVRLQATQARTPADMVLELVHMTDTHDGGIKIHVDADRDSARQGTGPR